MHKSKNKIIRVSVRGHWDWAIIGVSIKKNLRINIETAITDENLGLYPWITILCIEYLDLSELYTILITNF